MVLFEALAGLFEDPALVAVHETEDGRNLIAPP
jgi:hypothetical protein